MKKLLAFLLLAASVAQGQIVIKGGGVAVKDSNVVYPSYDRFKKDSIARAAALAGKVGISDTATMLANYRNTLATNTGKLATIATGATANSSDATLLSRANHTGTQAQSTVTNLPDSLAAKVNVVSGKALSTNDYTTGEKTKLAAIPDSYLGQVATRCFIPTNKYGAATGQWTLARSEHIARERIVNPTVVFSNFTVSQSMVETVVGNGTMKVSLEYPVGTFTLANEVIANGNNGVAVSGAFRVLTFNVVIPANAKFYFRTLQVNDNGPAYMQYQKGWLQPSTEGFESGTGTPSDKTTSGTVTYSYGAVEFTYGPTLILAKTNQPSVVIIGDSKQVGGTETLSDQTGDFGELARAIGPVYGYANLGIAGSLLNNYNTSVRTARDQIINGTISGISSGTPYFTHIANGYGINDLAGGATAATLATRRATFAALYSSTLPVIGTTLTPYNQSTDYYATTTNQTLGSNQPKVLAFNDIVRSGISGESYYWDIADAVDPYRLGRWPVSRNPNDTARKTSGVFTGAISGSTLTLSAVTSGSLSVGDPIAGPNIQPSTFITALGTGTGGTGTYTVNISQTAASGSVSVAGFATSDGLHTTAAMSEIIRNSGAVKLQYLKR